MKSCMTFAKGVGTGIVVGVAAAATLKCMCSNNRTFKKKTDKAARAVSSIMENIQNMLG